jgi:hypothetical protein
MAVTAAAVGGKDSGSGGQKRQQQSAATAEARWMTAGHDSKQRRRRASRFVRRTVRWRIGRRIMHGKVRGEVVLSSLASVEPYGRNTTKANIALFPLEGGIRPSARGINIGQRKYQLI